MEMLLPGANVSKICTQAHTWKQVALRDMGESLNGSVSPDAMLRAENTRLKRILVEKALIIDRIQETLGGNPRR